jgi:hypothetical protein
VEWSLHRPAGAEKVGEWKRDLALPRPREVRGKLMRQGKHEREVMQRKCLYGELLLLLAEEEWEWGLTETWRRCPRTSCGSKREDACAHQGCVSIEWCHWGQTSITVSSAKESRRAVYTIRGCHSSGAFQISGQYGVLASSSRKYVAITLDVNNTRVSWCYEMHK